MSTVMAHRTSEAEVGVGIKWAACGCALFMREQISIFRPIRGVALRADVFRASFGGGIAFRARVWRRDVRGPSDKLRMTIFWMGRSALCGGPGFNSVERTANVSRGGVFSHLKECRLPGGDIAPRMRIVRMTPELSPELQGGAALPGQSPADRHDAESHSRLALEAAGVGIWIWDISSNSLVWDDITHAHFGVKPGEFTVRRENMERLIHPDDCDRVRAEVARCARTGVDFSSEYRVIWPRDRSVHFLRSRGKIYREEQSVRLTGACWDITERKSMEEELARERFLLRTLMEHMPDKIYFKDTESRFVRVSGAMLTWFGAEDAAEVVGKTDFDFFAEEHARKAFEDEQRIIHSGEPLLNHEEKEIWPDGSETWVSTSKLPLRDSSGRIIGSIWPTSRDITERRRAEAQLAKYAEELRRKNQELEEDLGMARELQNALLPRRYPCFPRDVTPMQSALHFSHFLNASASVSGDFFDILQLSDNTAGIFICDVMGHGMRAALVAAIVRALVAELKGIGDTPGEFLHALNRKLSAILKQTDIPMFASASYVVADIEKGEFRYAANAGHPHPLCVRHDGSVTRTTPLNHCKRGPVLGMFENAEYGTYRHDLSVHDIVLSFTDGLFEVEGAGGELYDERSLMSAIDRRANLAGGELCRQVLTEIQQFSASKQFSDDVCLVSVEVERLTALEGDSLGQSARGSIFTQARLLALEATSGTRAIMRSKILPNFHAQRALAHSSRAGEERPRRAVCARSAHPR